MGFLNTSRINITNIVRNLLAWVEKASQRTAQPNRLVSGQ